MEDFLLELDEAGNFSEVTTLELELEVSCLDIGEIQRVKWAVLYCCWLLDNTVRILPGSRRYLKQLSLVTLKGRPESVCFARMAAESRVTASCCWLQGSSLDYNLYLHIGLQNGVMHRLAVDAVSGSTSDSRVRVLGRKSVKLFRVMVQGQRGVLALTTRLGSIIFIKVETCSPLS